MNILTVLEQHGTVLNKEVLETFIKPIESGGPYSSEFYETKVYYYAADSKNVRSYSFVDKDKADFKIVKFHRTRELFDQAWCFGFYKHPHNGWVGAYGGNHLNIYQYTKDLVKAMRAKITKPSTATKFPRTISRHDLFIKCTTETIAESIYSLLLDTQEWEQIGGVTTLATYLSNLIYVSRNMAMLKDTYPEGAVLVTTGSTKHLIINTGLIDKYTNFIYIDVTLVPTSNTTLTENFLAVAKINILQNLSTYSISSLGVNELLVGSQLPFPEKEVQAPHLQDIQHILADRNDRSAKKIDLTLEELHSSLLYSLRITNNSLAVDKSYLAPFRNIKWNKVSYLMPFFIQQIDTSNPVCALVVAKDGSGNWVPVTSLPIQTAINNARLLGQIKAKWLLRKVGNNNEDN